jgi:glycosyltransferase involved in cell wall biosynthesis
MENNTSGLKLLSVIIPVFNEATSFREVFKRIKAVPLPMEIIVVDDGSTDGTRELLKSIENETLSPPPPDEQVRPLLKVLYHPKNQGKGASIRTGIQAATGDLLIIQDADMEYSPSEYPRLIEPILSGDADVVYGSRFRGEKTRVHLFWHTIGNKFLTLLSNIFTDLNLTDMETCYKVFKTEIIKGIPLRSNRFGFEPEITAKIAKLRCRVYEMPISYKGRSYSEGKKIGWKDGVSAVYTILKFWLIDDLYEKTTGLRTLRIMEGAGKYNEWLFQQVRAFLGSTVLEGGSGVGNITKYLVGKKKVIATDVSEFYLDELNRNFGHLDNVQVERLDLLDQAAIEKISKKHSFDTFLSLNVLEHIQDDQAAINNIFRALQPNGRLVILVPAHQFLYSQIDKNLDHFRRYSKKDLKEILEKAGFQMERIKYLNFLGAIGWFINGKILRRKLLPSRQVRTFDWLLFLLKIEAWISPPFGLSVMAVAKKPD